MLKFNFIKEYGIAPTVAHPGEDIGYDLYSPYIVKLHPNITASIHTGVAIEFDPPAGAIIMARSSIAKNEIIVLGGVIDASYRNEIIVMLRNLGTQTFELGRGSRFAQLIEIPSLATVPEQVTELSAGGSRGLQGFGSSGV